MIRCRKSIFFFLALFMINQIWAQQKVKSLSLEDCILRAMKDNLNVAVQVLNPELADISISQAREKFLPSLSIDYGTRNTASPSFSFIEAGVEVKSERNDYSVYLSQLIPAGGSFTVSLSSDRNESNQKFLTVNPRYSTILQFNFSQPLLKDFGFKISSKDIIVAKNNRDISENQFKKILMDTIYYVESAYWDLTFSIENLKVMRQSLKLAKDLLAKNEREVEVGTLAPIEILSAEAEVATREADILQAESMVKNSEDRLKTTINISAREDDVGVEIIPVDKPKYEKREISLEEALVTAIENRPDLQATRVDLKNREINLSYAKNQLLPDLRLNASYWSPGLSGTQIQYDPLNPFGDPISTIPGTSSDAIKDALNFKYKNWAVRLSLTIPLNSFIYRAQHAQAKVNLEQTVLQIKDQEQQLFLEIKEAVRAVQTDYKRVQAYKLARELAEKKLEAEQKKLKVGLSTNYVVLQQQRDLSNARSSELRAIIDYNLSLANLDKAMGTSLKNKNIRLSKILEMN